MQGGSMSGEKSSRRDFLKFTGAGVASTALGVKASSYSRVLGANDRVRVAICGVRGRGNDHIHGFARVPGTDIAALCDVDENVLNQRLGDVEKLGVPKPKSYVDVRKLLEDKDIDAISIATPNHWHSLMAIWACQAGKDVYVEKPCSHNCFEGRQLVRAVKKYNRICQHGSQSRSNPGMLEAIHHLSDGTIGDVYMARALCYKWRPTIGHATEEPVPGGVNYDLWTGPAPLKPFTRNRFHYNWHWIWDTGNGEVGNQAIHEIDIARWGLGVGFPVCVSAIGGYDAYKTWLTNQAEPGPHGKGSGDHYANFIDCVRSRRAQDVHSPIEEAHISTTLVHLANASYRLGRALRFDAAQEQVIGDEEANRLLRGSYRAPYIVPEEI